MVEAETRRELDEASLFLNWVFNGTDRDLHRVETLLFPASKSA